MAVAHQVMKTRPIKTAYLTSASSEQATGKIPLKVELSLSGIQRFRPIANKHSGVSSDGVTRAAVRAARAKEKARPGAELGDARGYWAVTWGLRSR